MDNPTTLTDLQSEKDLLERLSVRPRRYANRHTNLRQAGREHALTAHVWQAEFAASMRNW
jgi:hypothetical protein